MKHFIAGLLIALSIAPIAGGGGMSGAQHTTASAAAAVHAAPDDMGWQARRTS